VVSTVIATAELLLDSAATIIGAMVVAPLMGPALSASVSVVVVSLTRNVGSVLIGVAIAVVLVPPAATVGLGIAWGHPTVVATSGTLVLVNLLSINLTTLILLWVAGYRPHLSENVDRVYGRLRSRVVVLIVAVAVLSVVLGIVTHGTY
jgi:uncharacterized membrane protein